MGGGAVLDVPHGVDVVSVACNGKTSPHHTTNGRTGQRKDRTAHTTPPTEGKKCVGLLENSKDTNHTKNIRIYQNFIIKPLDKFGNIRIIVYG